MRELCNTCMEENLEHLFIHYHFAASCWNLIQLQVPHQATIFEEIDNFKAPLQTPISMSIIVVLGWTMWTSRDNVIFQNQRVSMFNCRTIFKKEVTLLQHCVKPKHPDLLAEWINNFVIFLLSLIFFLTIFVFYKSSLKRFSFSKLYTKSVGDEHPLLLYIKNIRKAQQQTEQAVTVPPRTCSFVGRPAGSCSSLQATALGRSG